MSNSKDSNTVVFTGLYVMPGGDTVAELVEDERTVLFDRQGLQHRITERRRNGDNTNAEEQALLRINQYSNSP